MKLFKQESQRRIHSEIGVLRHLNPGPNIIQLIDVVQGEEGNNIGIVLEYVNNTDFRSLYPRFSDLDIRYYTRELLKALEFAHSQGVMHRDIRPHNVVIGHDSRKLRLVGWSSAEFYQPNEEYDVCVGVFKPPELLLSYEKYDYSIDMWNFGSMLASMVFRKEPFFHGNSILDQLDKICQVLGTDPFYRFARQYDIDLDQEYTEALGDQPRQEWTNFENPDNRRLVTAEAIGLIDLLLRFDPGERLTAAQALEHAYYEVFDETVEEYDAAQTDTMS
ncbi:hypothetical protein ACHAPJ_003753 [Fusarium lateritium]